MFRSVYRSRWTMKTLIVFLLSTANYILVNARYPPLEVFEIRETKDKQLRVKNENEQYGFDYDSPLSKLFKPYNGHSMDTDVEKVYQNLMNIIKRAKKKTNKNNDQLRQRLFIITGQILQPELSSVSVNSGNDDNFLDETRTGTNDFVYKFVPQKRVFGGYYRTPRSNLRTGDHTHAPRHHYKYAKDDINNNV